MLMITKQYKYRMSMVVIGAVIGIVIGNLILIAVVNGVYNFVGGFVLTMSSILLISAGILLLRMVYLHNYNRRCRITREQRLANIQAMEEVKNEHLDGV